MIFKEIAVVIGGLGLLLHLAQAGVGRKEIPGRLLTHLTPGEIAREGLDQQVYPNFMTFISSVDVSGRIYPTDPRNSQWIKTSHYFNPDRAMWDRFFKAAAKDHLTCLRAFALLARELKKNGVVVFGSSVAFEQAVANNKVDLGLALPARNLAASVWSPDPNHKDPEFLAHIKVFYTEPYIHQFPDEILPANLKIGFAPPETFWLEGKQYQRPALDADIYYGPGKKIGFRNVKGVGGQKRGVMGFFQKVFFFLPDAVSSMTIDEAKNEMITEALVNTVVKDFETNPLYSIKVRTQ